MGKRRLNPGVLIAIGGHEQRQGDMPILRAVAAELRTKKIVVATLASSESEELWKEYKHAFTALDVEPIHLSIEERAQGLELDADKVLEGVGGVFFTGGDQVALTSKIGGTAFCETMHKLREQGLLIAGTSAGASVLSETMVVASDAEQTHRIGGALLMAPGLGFVPGVVIDQHFAERGRIGRLLGVIAQSPRTLGLGIDEDTAVLIKGDQFQVMGSGAVYVVDGKPITHTNLSEGEQDRTMSIFDVRLHVLSDNDCFDLSTRRPSREREAAPSRAS